MIQSCLIDSIRIILKDTFFYSYHLFSFFWFTKPMNWQLLTKSRRNNPQSSCEVIIFILSEKRRHLFLGWLMYLPIQIFWQLYLVGVRSVFGTIVNKATCFNRRDPKLFCYLLKQYNSFLLYTRLHDYFS